jgi:hypothetical protein
MNEGTLKKTSLFSIHKGLLPLMVHIKSTPFRRKVVRMIQTNKVSNGSVLPY